VFDTEECVRKSRSAYVRGNRSGKHICLEQWAKANAPRLRNSSVPRLQCDREGNPLPHHWEAEQTLNETAMSLNNHYVAPF